MTRNTAHEDSERRKVYVAQAARRLRLVQGQKLSGGECVLFEHQTSKFPQGVGDTLERTKAWAKRQVVQTDLWLETSRLEKYAAWETAASRRVARHRRAGRSRSRWRRRVRKRR